MEFKIVLLFCSILIYGVDSFFLFKSQKVLFKSELKATSHLVELLTGNFSNKEQATADAAEGKLTGIEGGHEFVIAFIQKHPSIPDILVASYYYGNDMSSAFRYRLYEVCGENKLLMKLYRPTIKHNEALKLVNYAPIDAPRLEDFEYLDGCDVEWKQIGKESGQPVYEGTLKQGKCTICSQQDPTRKVTIEDNLRLSMTELWINDRVYSTTGDLIIGNSDGVPYKLKRI